MLRGNWRHGARQLTLAMDEQAPESAEAIHVWLLERQFTMALSMLMCSLTLLPAEVPGHQLLQKILIEINAV